MLDESYHDDAGHFVTRFAAPRSGDVLDIDPNNVTAPFPIRRVYWLVDTTDGVVRGKHAHRQLKQLCMVAAGSCTFTMEDAHGTSEVVLDRPDKALFLEGLVWREIKDFSPGCVVVVFADSPYNEADYIRDYAEFHALAHA